MFLRLLLIRYFLSSGTVESIQGPSRPKIVTRSAYKNHYVVGKEMDLESQKPTADETANILVSRSVSVVSNTGSEEPGVGAEYIQNSDGGAEVSAETLSLDHRLQSHQPDSSRRWSHPVKCIPYKAFAKEVTSRNLTPISGGS